MAPDEAATPEPGGGPAAPPQHPLEPFREANYISLTSFRRDGTGVATPVWFVFDENRLIMRSYGESFKVKRMRRNASVTVAPATASGDVQGDQVPARAAVLSKEDRRGVRRRFVAKYPLGYLLEIVIFQPFRKVATLLRLARGRGPETFFELLPEAAPEQVEKPSRQYALAVLVAAGVDRVGQLEVVPIELL